MDDNEEFLEQARSFLEQSGRFTRVDTASSGEEALARLAAGRHQVLIADVRLPGMDGLELTRQARALASPPRVLLLSLFEPQEYAPAGRQAGAEGFVSKWAFAQDLLAALDALGFPANP